MEIRPKLTRIGLVVALVGLLIPWPVRGPLAEEQSDDTNQLKVVEDEERRILDELDGVERQMGFLQDRLAAIEEETAKARRRLGDNDQEIRDGEKKIKELKKYLARRLKAIYCFKDSGLLQVLLQADSLQDLLRRYRYLSMILRRDEETIRSYAGRIAEVKARQAQIKADQANLYQLRTELTVQREKLETVRRHKTGLLMQVHQRKELFQAVLRSREESRERLIKDVIVEGRNAAREEPEQEGRAPARSPTPTGERKWPDFVGTKGRLPRPVTGEIGARFGKVVGPFNTILTRHGMVFLAASGTEVKAVLEGEVLHTGWLRGYGWIVILNHGRRYYTLVGGLANPRLQAGEWVTQGQALGVVPPGGQEEKKEIYFEIRQGGQALDPLSWLKDKS